MRESDTDLILLFTEAQCYYCSLVGDETIASLLSI